MTTCNIHSIESMAARDGDGVRCAIFFCGCPLRCVYCHNPDTWHTSGQAMTAADVAKKIIRYKPYFKKGGGATFSGGEPLLHAEFINEVAEILRDNDIKYILDTSGSVPLTPEVQKAVLGAEALLIDIKLPSEDGYAEFCKGSLVPTLALAKFCTENNKRITFRTVIVPGINDTFEVMEQYTKIAKQFSFEKYELLPFHTMGFFKYENLGIKNPLADTPAMEIEKLKQLQRYINTLL